MSNFVEVNDACEIIDGEKFMAPSANIAHYNIVVNLIVMIGGYAGTNKLGYIFSVGLSNELLRRKAF